jgi:hypothetical protein
MLVHTMSYDKNQLNPGDLVVSTIDGTVCLNHAIPGRHELLDATGIDRAGIILVIAVVEADGYFWKYVLTAGGELGWTAQFSINFMRISFRD